MTVDSGAQEGAPLYRLLPNIGMCSPKGYGFSAILVIIREWVLHSSLDVGMVFRESHFFIIIEKKINKSPSQIMFAAN